MNRNTFFISLLFLSLAAGCSGDNGRGGPAEIADIENLTIIEPNLSTISVLHPEAVLTLGNTDSTSIGMMASMVSDDSGRIFIADSQQRFIHVFSPTGSLIATLGRDGEGPGEFRGLGDLRISGDQLHVLDPAQLRISRYDLSTLKFNGATDISADGSPSEHFLPQTYFVQPDGSYLMILTGPPVQGETDDQSVWDTVILNRDGNWADSIHLSVPATEWLYEFTDDYQISLKPPYGRTSLLQTEKSGHLYHVWTDDLLVKAYDETGRYEKAWFVDYPKLELDRKVVMELFESQNTSNDPRFSRLIRNHPMPDTWPAMNQFLIDDEGRFWISTYTKEPDQWCWLVLNPVTEKIEGTFIWPKSRYIHQIKNGFIYSWGDENTTGNQTLSVFRHLLN